MLGFPLPFYWLSGVKWATGLGWDFWPSHLQFYPGVYVTSVITLLTYPVSTYQAERSFSGMKRLQTPLRRTMTEKRLSSLAILHMSASYGRNWYWWHYNRVCLSVGYTSRPWLVTSLMASLFYPFLPWTLYLTDNTRARGGGGTPIHYLYGYVPPNGVGSLKLLV